MTDHRISSGLVKYLDDTRLRQSLECERREGGGAYYFKHTPVRGRLLDLFGGGRGTWVGGTPGLEVPVGVGGSGIYGR